MEIINFCEKVKKGLETYLGEEVTVTINKITKNNGVILNSIIISQKEKNVSPNIYLDEFFQLYEKGETFQAVMDKVMEIYRESILEESVDMDFFLNYGKMKTKVAYKIIGYEKNKELLKQIPHMLFLDLAVVFYCCVSEGELNSATILIYNNHLKMWGITREQLYSDAKANIGNILPARIISIEKMMEEIFAADLKKEFLLGESREDEFMPNEDWFDRAAKQLLSAVSDGPENGSMFVLGNTKKLFGAAAILYEGVLDVFSEKLSKDIFILPSSIHEVILVPDDGNQEAEELWKMVCEINATQVEPEDVLTDSVYYYSAQNKKIKKLF